MTGLYADQTRIRKNNVYLRSAVPDVVTLSQRFRQRGMKRSELARFSTMTIRARLAQRESMTAIRGTGRSTPMDGTSERNTASTH